jgi:hypothetical protein
MTRHYAHDEGNTVRTHNLLLGILLLAVAVPAAAQRRAAPRRAWEPAIGIAGGYYIIYLPGQGSLDGFAAPGTGFGGLLPVAPSPTGLFAILPIGEKLALEPSFDAHRTQSGGTTTFTGQLLGRLDYAWKGGWYGAAGANLLYFKSTGASATTVLGVNVGWGYRFRLTRNLGGRFEASYLMYPQNDDLGQATNTFGLSFGVTMPLK